MIKEARKDIISSAKKIETAAEAFLKDEISCTQLERLVWPELESIRRTCSQDKNASMPCPKISSESAASREPVSATSEPELELLRQALRSIVGKLIKEGQDPLDHIYTVGAQIIEDFCHSNALPAKETERLWVFRELAYERALLFDEDPSFLTEDASRLREKIQQAASDYLKGTIP